MTRHCLLILALSPLLSFAQDTSYARRLVDTLTAPGMEGRGYVNDGDNKAALFIAQEFRKFKADSFTNGYFQPFDFPVNTFPGKMKVMIDGSELKPGADFIVDPASSGGKGSYKIIEMVKPPSAGLRKDVKQKFVLIDKTKAPSKAAADSMNQWKEMDGIAGIIFIEEKKAHLECVHFSTSISRHTCFKKFNACKSGENQH